MGCSGRGKQIQGLKRKGIQPVAAHPITLCRARARGRSWHEPTTRGSRVPPSLGPGQGGGARSRVPGQPARPAAPRVSPSRRRAVGPHLPAGPAGSRGAAGGGGSRLGHRPLPRPSFRPCQLTAARKWRRESRREPSLAPSRRRLRSTVPAPPLRHGRASGERSPSKCPRPAAHRTTCRPRLSAPPRPATSAGGRLGALQKHRRLPPSRAGVRSAERCARSPPLSCCSSARHRALLCLCTGRVGAGRSRSVSVAAPAGLPGATGSFLRLCGGASLFSQRSPVRVPHLAVRRGVGSGGLVVPQTHHGFSSAQPACGPCGLWEERNEAWVLSENGMPLTGVLPLGLLLCFGFCFSVEFL